MNEAHRELLASEEWRGVLRDMAFPFAFEEIELADLGEDVLEVGPGPGLATDLLAAVLPRLTCLELDPPLATQLATRVDPAA